MRVIINLVVILPCYLAHVHGLVIPRQVLDGAETAPALPFDNLEPNLPVENLDGSPVADNFVTDYTDSSGVVHPLDYNPAIINEDLLNQLQTDPWLLNEPFADQDQLHQTLPPLDSSEPPPSTELFDPNADPDYFTNSYTIPPPIDGIWDNDFNP